VRLYLDENVSPRVAEMLRAREVDAVSAHEGGNTRLDDRNQLRVAARDGRVLVTCDVKDFAPVLGEVMAANLDHSGILLVPSSFGTEEFVAIVEAILEIVRLYPDGLKATVVSARRRRP
jgi:hypothetical protein